YSPRPCAALGARRQRWCHHDRHVRSPGVPMAARRIRLLQNLRLRPSRHARSVSGMRYDAIDQGNCMTSPSVRYDWKALAAERDSYVDWTGALQATPGNPWRAAVGHFGAATVVCCTGCPARIINRCFGLEPSTASHLPDILAFFAEHEALPSFDLDPFVDYT